MKLRSPLTPRFTNLNRSPLSDEIDALIVPIWELDPFPDRSAEIDRVTNGLLSALRKSDDFVGKAGETWSFIPVDSPSIRRWFFIGMGKYEPDNLRANLEGFATAAFQLSRKKLQSLGVWLPPTNPLDTLAKACCLGTSLGASTSGLRKTDPTRFLPAEVRLYSELDLSEIVHVSAIEALAVARCRDLVNLPPSEVFPETIVHFAEQLSHGHGISLEIWDRNRLESERMGGILGVGRGSDRPPYLLILRYRGIDSDQWSAFVGKGVTFDSGGLSLKTSEQMADMKCDMAGGATVLTAMLAISELKLPVNIIGLIPLVENMVNGSSMKLGDVLTMRNGKTVEVLNTDAEGRLILADALSLATELKVKEIVDLATLTGSCMVALGTEIAGLMTNHEPFSTTVLHSIHRAGERAWQLPMDSDFADLLRSQVADMKNIPSNRYGGAISAGKFLESFVSQTPWVHLDIAGPAFSDHEKSFREAGATGAYVRSLIELARTLGRS